MDIAQYTLKRLWSKGRWSLSLCDGPEYCWRAEKGGDYRGRSLAEIERKILAEQRRATGALRVLRRNRRELARACRNNPPEEIEKRFRDVQKRLGVDFGSAVGILHEAEDKGVPVDKVWERWMEGYRKLKELEKRVRLRQIGLDEHEEKILGLRREYGSGIGSITFTEPPKRDFG